jgi:hypothetical protein
MSEDKEEGGFSLGVSGTSNPASGSTGARGGERKIIRGARRTKK